MGSQVHRPGAERCDPRVGSLLACHSSAWGEPGSVPPSGHLNRAGRARGAASTSSMLWGGSDSSCELNRERAAPRDHIGSSRSMTQANWQGPEPPRFAVENALIREFLGLGFAHQGSRPSRCRG